MSAVTNPIANGDPTYTIVVTTVAALPSASLTKGARMMVTDASTTLTLGIGTIVAAGGTNNVPVHSDGTNWRLG
jgi:hypothetical protein